MLFRSEKEEKDKSKKTDVDVLFEMLAQPKISAKKDDKPVKVIKEGAKGVI